MNSQTPPGSNQVDFLASRVKGRIFSVKRSLCAGLFAVCLAATLHSAVAQTNTNYYNLVPLNLVTAVQNQGQLGFCWAFADTTVFQSAILKSELVGSPTNPAVDLSTWHLATQNGSSVNTYYPPYNEFGTWGGFDEFAIGYWTRGRGQWNLVTNIADSQPTAGGGPVMTSNNTNNIYPLAKVDTWQNLSGSVPPASQTQAPYMLSQTVTFTYNTTDYTNVSSWVNTIQNAVLKYGALAVGVETDAQGVYTNIYYGGSSSGHAVTIVGWNSTNQFKVSNSYGNITNITGGWIIQNSDWAPQVGPDRMRCFPMVDVAG